MKFTILLSSLLILTASQAQIITTVAGNGTGGYSGDGGLAINAKLGDMYYTYPAFDNVGNMYIAQSGNNTIRKIDAAGIITTIAGTDGVLGYTGDGGPAINALLYHPTSIAVDNANNIIFADANGDYIRKISPSGIITTISGQATITCGFGDGGLLINARFQAISSLTIDNSDNLYIADFGCNTIRKVNNSGVVTTIAGNGTWGYSGDGGIATNAQLAYPCKVAVDNTGNVYIADAQNHRIRKVSTTGIITTIAGNGTSGYIGDGGPATNAQLSFPGSVVIDNSGNIYTGDYNNVIRKIDPAGIISTYAGTGVFGYSGDGGVATLAQIHMSEGRISIDNNNNIYFDDESHYVVRKISNCLAASITQQPLDFSLCNSGNATYSINANNVANFQWQENTGAGWNNLTDNATYNGTASNFLNIIGTDKYMNGFQYRCKTTNSCGSIFSSPATLKVTTPSTPVLNVVTTSNAICTGTNTTFTASPINGGTSPTYQWKKNGVNVGANNNIYTDNALVTGDIINCVLTSNSSCITTATISSNSITITVNTPLTPAITISPSLNNICFGTIVTFNATPLNEGSSPIYKWEKNGVNVGANLQTYTDNTLNNGDIITCFLTSNQACITTSTANSNTIVMAVNPLVTPAVTIGTSNQSICSGKSGTFFAIAANAGSLPVYQWKKNGINVGTNINSYTSSSLINGDMITCIITSNSNCFTTNSATSNSIAITIFQNPIVSLDKTQTLCTGSNKTFDAGNFNSYLWNNGSNSRTFTINTIGSYYVTVTDVNGCTGSDTAKVTTLLQPPYKFLPSDTSVCAYGSLSINAKPGFENYLWSNNSTQPSLSVTQAGLYWLEVIDNNNCTGKDTIWVIPKDCIKGFYIPAAFTPNNDGKNDYFKPLLFGNVKKYKFFIYNRWGQIVFQTVDFTKGWDGSFKDMKQNGNVFVWICSYQFENEPEESKKGTVVLIK